MGWENLSQLAGDVQALVGTTDTRNDPGRVRELVRAVDARGVRYWIDQSNADGWFQYFGAVVSAASERAIDALPYAQQVARVIEVWEAMGNVYRALNLVPFADLGFQAVMEGDHHGSDSGVWCEDRAWAEWARTRGAYFDEPGVPGCISIHQRLALRADGTVVTAYVHADETSTDYWTDHFYYRADGTPTWKSWAWHHQRGQDGFWENRLFPPLHLYFLQARRVYELMRARGFLVTILQAHRQVLVRNLRLAKALGVLRVAESDPALAAIDLAGRAEQGAALARATTPESGSEVLTGMATGLGILAAIPGFQVAAAIGGAIVALQRLLLEAMRELGLAVARVTDQYGRAAEVIRVRNPDGSESTLTLAYERAAMSPNVNAAPEQVLAPPPPVPTFRATPGDRAALLGGGSDGTVTGNEGLVGGLAVRLPEVERARPNLDLILGRNDGTQTGNEALTERVVTQEAPRRTAGVSGVVVAGGVAGLAGLVWWALKPSR